MAMMMTGRVLLVCALCVLWCGAGGRCDGGETAVPRSGGGELPPGSAERGTPRQETQDLNVGAPHVNGKVPSQSSPRIEKADDEDREGKDKKDEKENIKAITETHESHKNEGAPQSLSAPPPIPPIPPSGGPVPSSTAGEGGPTAEKENLQKVTKNDSEAPEPPSGDATQGQHSHDTDTEDSTRNAATGSPAEPTFSSTSASGSGDHVQNKADRDDAQSSEGQHDSLDTGNTNVVPTLSETAPQAETTTANTTHTTTKIADSDSSTAVSHSTSPLLLLLLLVACAAAAAVVAA
ncbi:Mucin-associated surface protein (MASP), subgroup S080 [Trypanosoma cruzi]|nr:Mucin-associated surface protein (MASP), subgroup S080 [Trypanosoma cruzi]